MPTFSEKSFNFAYLFKNITTRWYFYVIALGFIALIFLSLFLLRKKPQRNALSRTQKIAYTAILSALCFVANAFTLPISNLFQVSFIGAMGFIAGYVLGAGLGFTCAFIGDFLCAIIFPLGPYSPIINVGTALWGYIPGVIFTSVKGNDVIKTVLCFALGFVLNSFCINTVGLTLMYYTPFETLLPLLPVKLATVVVNFVISIGLCKVLKRVLPKDKFHLN